MNQLTFYDDWHDIDGFICDCMELIHDRQSILSQCQVYYDYPCMDSLIQTCSMF